MAADGLQDWAALNESVPAIDRYALIAPTTSKAADGVVQKSGP